MRRILATVFLSAALAATSAAQVTTWEIDPAHSSAHFSIKHMMVSNVRGEFARLKGSVQLDRRDIMQSSVEAVIDAASINTHEPKRDEHLRSPDFFDVAKYPTITFRSRRALRASEGKLNLVGDLTIHGVTKEVTLDVEGPTAEVKDQRGNARIGASATTRINRKDFGLTWNRALDAGGFVVGDEVSITIDVEAVHRAGREGAAP